jgi:hypothetical protein
MTLHEEILLLALKDDSGKVDWKAGMFQFVMAGALLAELMLDGRITLSQDKKKIVSVSNPNRHENTVLNEALDTIKQSRKERDIQHWVMKLSSLKGLKEKTATGLCRQGILREEESKVLFLFTTKKYPEINHEPEAQLINRLREAIFGAGEVDVRTGTLISLAYKPGILAIPFPAKELRKQKQRIKAIASGELIGKATGEAIASIQAAMAIIAVMPAITAAACPPSSPGC